MNTVDYPTLHLDIHSSKRAACSKKGYMDVNKQERLSSITLGTQIKLMKQRFYCYSAFQSQ